MRPGRRLIGSGVRTGTRTCTIQLHSMRHPRGPHRITGVQDRKADRVDVSSAPTGVKTRQGVLLHKPTRHTTDDGEPGDNILADRAIPIRKASTNSRGHQAV